MRRLIVQTFPEDANNALRVAECESGLNPTARNTGNNDGTKDSGVFQINQIHHKRMQSLGLDPYHAPDNVAFARILYDESGWRPWVCAWKHLAIAKR